jgi:cyclopropane fatty-acyl-phospholipid synthase-like methyltransferase
MFEDKKQHAPATARNRGPLLEVLRRLLPESGALLEVASGSGEHACHFAEALPGWTWQPTDADAAALDSIEAHRRSAGLSNLLPALGLDVTTEDWPNIEVDAILCVNMIHIAPWRCCEGLLRGASSVLKLAAPLILYGPFKRDGAHTAPSNEAFDLSLRRQNPEWGVRAIEDVAAAGTGLGLRLDGIVDMPSNNFCVVLRREYPDAV